MDLAEINIREAVTPIKIKIWNMKGNIQMEKHLRSSWGTKTEGNDSDADLAYSVDGDNFISMFTAPDEGLCRDSCVNTTSCLYYTFYSVKSDLMPNVCVLMSDSSEPVACKNCRTGPAICNFSAQCKEKEAFIMKSTPSTHGLITKNGTQKIETMGCWAKASVLLVGGGGTGGFSTGGVKGGGGGSGFIDHVTIEIPYSSQFYFQIGRGGVGTNNPNIFRRTKGAVDKWVQKMRGQETSIYDEFGKIVSEVKGGEAGSKNEGGNGYSGGGSASGKDGGGNGGDGECSYSYKGGRGSRFSVESLQNSFRHYKLVAAQ
ncbi:uncharacterized protein LOC142358456, partial [Convolutriloba macropyga]|uniref:uncharacterized protein LOC142358456 n=1 Tax=Convolutriloba macropyga TaxID=536237 RepID=UPI003F520D41